MLRNEEATLLLQLTCTFGVVSMNCTAAKCRDRGYTTSNDIPNGLYKYSLSTKPLSFSVSVWIFTWYSDQRIFNDSNYQHTWTSYLSPMSKQFVMTAGVDPQSSCNFSPAAPAFTMSSNAFGPASLPFPVNAKFIGSPSVAANMCLM